MATSAKDMEQYQAFLEKMNNPPFYFNPPKDPQAMPSEEISQAAMETHQEEQVNKEWKGHATSDEEKIAVVRAVMKELQTHPNPDPKLVRFAKKLLAEKWLLKEQEISVPRRKLAVPKNSGTSIIFVHGLNGQTSKGSDAGHDCTQYWGNAMNFLSSQGLGDLRTIGFYNQNQNCDLLYLSNPSYASRCTIMRDIRDRMVQMMKAYTVLLVSSLGP